MYSSGSSVKVVLGNITRNGIKNQWGIGLAVGQTGADIGGTDLHGRHFKAPQAWDFRG
jgi:hypothetical protein